MVWSFYRSVLFSRDVSLACTCDKWRRWRSKWVYRRVMRLIQLLRKIVHRVRMVWKCEVDLGAGCKWLRWKWNGISKSRYEYFSNEDKICLSLKSISWKKNNSKWWEIKTLELYNKGDWFFVKIAEIMEVSCDFFFVYLPLGSPQLPSIDQSIIFPRNWKKIYIKYDKVVALPFQEFLWHGAIQMILLPLTPPFFSSIFPSSVTPFLWKSKKNYTNTMVLSPSLSLLNNKKNVFWNCKFFRKNSKRKQVLRFWEFSGWIIFQWNSSKKY